MSQLQPLQTYLEPSDGEALPLPPELKRLYGELKFPISPGRPVVFTNFVSTIDGVVTLAVKGHASGADISGNNPYDHIVMGLLRSTAEAVIITANSLKMSPQHLWIGEDIYPALSEPYHQLRQNLGLKTLPLHTIVTAQGNLDLELPVFQSQRVPVLIVTTEKGLDQLGNRLPTGVEAVALKPEGRLDPRQVVDAVRAYFAVHQTQPVQRILVEGGPHLVGGFLGEKVLDELFLTLGSQVAGRVGTGDRYSFAEGRLFGPENPLWANLVGLKRADNFLFLRYRFDVGPSARAAGTPTG